MWGQMTTMTVTVKTTITTAKTPKKTKKNNAKTIQNDLNWTLKLTLFENDPNAFRKQSNIIQNLSKKAFVPKTHLKSIKNAVCI